MDTPMYDSTESAQARIVGWRVGCFERLGFTLDAAMALAHRRDVDAHEVGRMLRRGATHDQVQAIVL